MVHHCQGWLAFPGPQPSRCSWFELSAIPRCSATADPFMAPWIKMIGSKCRLLKITMRDKATTLHSSRTAAAWPGSKANRVSRLNCHHRGFPWYHPSSLLPIEADQKTVSVSNPCSGNGYHTRGNCHSVPRWSEQSGVAGTEQILRRLLNVEWKFLCLSPKHIFLSFLLSWRDQILLKLSKLGCTSR